MKLLSSVFAVLMVSLVMNPGIAREPGEEPVIRLSEIYRGLLTKTDGKDELGYGILLDEDCGLSMTDLRDDVERQFRQSRIEPLWGSTDELVMVIEISCLENQVRGQPQGLFAVIDVNFGTVHIGPPGQTTTMVRYGRGYGTLVSDALNHDGSLFRGMLKNGVDNALADYLHANSG